MNGTTTLDKVAELCCPDCGSSLTADEVGIECNGCKRKFSFVNGIPDLRLSQFDYYFNPIPRDKMRELTQSIDASTWVDKARAFVDMAPNETWIDNIAVQGRYSWKLLMNLPASGKVLDIGCGLGALINNIAHQVSGVYATDLTIERLEFTQRRFTVFNADKDIKVVASGDGSRLPFASDTFDAVFLSGVLEWVGEGDTSGFGTGGKVERVIKMIAAHFGDTNPRNIQLRFLKEILRILKPGGQLYVGIENRFNSEYLGKRRDHHSGLWYGSLMPRFAATLYSIAAAKQPYRTYTYGRKGYRKLFGDAGFSEPEFFAFHDGYSELKSITPAGADVKRWAPEETDAAQGGLTRHPDFVPAFGIVASKGQRPSSRLLDRLCDEIESTLDGQLTFQSFDVDEEDYAVLQGRIGGNDVRIKMPMSEVAEQRVQANAEALQGLSRVADLQKGLVPMVVAQGVHQHQPYLIESCVTGRPLAPDAALPVRRDSAVLVTKALAANLWSDTYGRFGADEFATLVAPKVDVLVPMVGNDELLKRGRQKLGAMLDGLPYRSGWMHGSLTLAKARFDEGICSGIVDWDTARSDGIPALDVLWLAGSAIQGDSGADALQSAVSSLMDDFQWNDPVLQAAMGGCLDRSQLTSANWRGLVHLYWLHAIVDRLPFGLQYSSKRIQHAVTPLFNALAREAVE